MGTWEGYYNSIVRFEFSYDNPLFWIFVAVLFFILAGFWGAKKSLSFCLMSAAILLISSKVEESFGGFVTMSGESFDPMLVRAVSVFIIIIMFLYYSFIRE